jgi:hypothetical protein
MQTIGNHLLELENGEKPSPPKVADTLGVPQPPTKKAAHSHAGGTDYWPNTPTIPSRYPRPIVGAAQP